LWLAWLAWLDKAQAAHVDMNATTDGYTPEQRFWIAYAQQWCTQTRPEQLRTQAQTDPHAPDEYRTNTVLRICRSLPRASVARWRRRGPCGVPAARSGRPRSRPPASSRAFDVGRRGLLGVAADLADHDDGVVSGSSLNSSQRVHEMVPMMGSPPMPMQVDWPMPSLVNCPTAS
jgi:hypothetical protein